MVGINKDYGKNADFEDVRGAHPVGGSKVTPYPNRSSVEQVLLVKEWGDPLLKFGQKNEIKVNKNVFLYLSPYHPKKLVVDIKIWGRGIFYPLPIRQERWYF